MKENTIDLFTGKTVSEVEEETDEGIRLNLEERLEDFDSMVAVCRAAIENHTLDGLIMSGIIDGSFSKTQFISVSDPMHIAILSVLSQDITYELNCKAMDVITGRVSDE